MGKKQVVLKILIWLIDDKSEIKKILKKCVPKTVGGVTERWNIFHLFYFFICSLTHFNGFQRCSTPNFYL